MKNQVDVPIAFDGFVDDFEQGIGAIQFSLDNGASWTTYATEGAEVDKGVNWQFSYTPEAPGRYLLKVRAVDGAGNCSDLISGYAFEVEQ